jgi:hypothetical protein
MHLPRRKLILVVPSRAFYKNSSLTYDFTVGEALDRFRK